MAGVGDHPVHAYTDNALDLENTLIERLNTLSPE
jgi:hypothetical protein